MSFEQYQFKFYFDASHAIYISGKLGQSHPHTWEVIINMIRLQSAFIPFDVIEKKIESFIIQYQDVYMNQMAPFNTINPTLENITYYFKEHIEKILFDNGWLFLSIEVSETPARAFIIDISDEIYKKLEVKSNNHEQDHVVDSEVASRLKHLSEQDMQPISKKNTLNQKIQLRYKKSTFIISVGMLIVILGSIAYWLLKY